MDYTGKFAEMMRYFSTNGGFLTAKSARGVNTMTIAWGFVGFMWAKPHFLAVVRPQRYTRAILKEAADFTVSVPFGTLKDELRICGTQSGRDTDKGEVVAFAPARAVASPIVADCGLYYECLIRHTDALNAAGNAHLAAFYPADDYHELFFGEIVDCY